IGFERLHGRVQYAYPHGIARLRCGKTNGPTVIRDRLGWLLARGANIAPSLPEFCEAGREGDRPHTRADSAADQASDALGALDALRAMGLREPLYYALYCAWAYCSAANPERGVQAASKQWHGSGGGFAESQGDALRQVLRGCDPFADDATLLRFADAAMLVFLAVRDGTVYGGIDPESLAGLARRYEQEDGE